MPNRQTAEEVARIEHGLEILRTRHALMARWSRVVRVFFAIVLAVSAITLAGALVYAFVIDIVVGLFILGIGTVAAGALWINCDIAPNRDLDRADAPPSQFYPLGLSFSWDSFIPNSWVWFRPNQKSDAETIEDMIALREKRLAELKRASSL